MKTQKEIAKEVGVSETAVSLVLNNRPIQISEEKKNRIIQIARESGYFKAKSISSTNTICYIISQDIRSPYYNRFFVGVQEELEKNQYHMMVSNFDIGKKMIRKTIEKVDGFIIQGHRLLSKRFVEYLNRFKPVVLLNYFFPDADIDSVMPDNFAGTRKVINYLYKLGHRRIGFFGMSPLQLHHFQRYNAYLETLDTLKIEARKEWVSIPVIKDRSIIGSEPYVKNYLRKIKQMKNPPTAIFCAWDGHAFCFLKLASSMGILIPRDISVIGFDYDKRYIEITPELSSVNQPMEEMGREAVRQLLDRIKNPEKVHSHIFLDVELKISKSVSRPKIKR